MTKRAKNSNSTDTESSSPTLSNWDVVALSVFLLGGATRPIDTEDVAMKVHEIAPGRFAWRKYPDQINLELIRSALSHAKSPGGLVDGSGNKGWQMTPAGMDRMTSLQEIYPSLNLSREAISQPEKAWRKSERARLLTSRAYSSLKDGGLSSVTRADAESFFRLNEYVVGAARKRRIDRIENAFRDDPELSDEIRVLAEMVKEEKK